MATRNITNDRRNCEKRTISSSSLKINYDVSNGPTVESVNSKRVDYNDGKTAGNTLDVFQLAVLPENAIVTEIIVSNNNYSFANDHGPKIGYANAKGNAFQKVVVGSESGVLVGHDNYMAGKKGDTFAFNIARSTLVKQTRSAGTAEINAGVAAVLTANATKVEPVNFTLTGTGKILIAQLHADDSLTDSNGVGEEVQITVKYYEPDVTNNIYNNSL